MWILLIMFSPLIYLIVSYIFDYVSDIEKEAKRKKYYGEEELFHLNTYQNKNISEDDIMNQFLTQIKRYRKTYYNLTYKVFCENEKQNYAWSVRVTKDVFGWGQIYNVRFHFSNGWVMFQTSNVQFTSNGISANYYYVYTGYDLGSYEIDNNLSRCLDEARIMWKKNGKNPAGNRPFNFILVENSHYESKKKFDGSANQNKESSSKDSSWENPKQQDLLVFYRNLLGLKLNFTSDELKKSYHKAAGRYHPDSYGTSSKRDRENAEMLMKQINEAYESLKTLAA